MALMTRILELASQVTYIILFLLQSVATYRHAAAVWSTHYFYTSMPFMSIYFKHKSLVADNALHTVINYSSSSSITHTPYQIMWMLMSMNILQNELFEKWHGSIFASSKAGIMWTKLNFHKNLLCIPSTNFSEIQ
jgi:hypothetical protein